MMNLFADMDADFSSVFLDKEAFAKEAVYWHDGEAKTVNVLAWFDVDPDRYTAPGRNTAHIVCSVSDVPDISAGDMFEIDGVDWTVSSIETDGGRVNILAGRT